MPSRNTIQIVINADDNASQVIGDVVGSIQGIGEAALAITGAALAGASAAVIGFATSSLDAFGNFEVGVNEIFSILPGITEEAMGQMEDSIQAFMEQTGRSAQEATGAIYEALSAGVPQDNIWEFMKVANMAAVGGVTDLQTAVDGLTSVVNAYGSEAYTAAEASDILFEAVRLGKLNMEDLSNFMYQVVPVAASMGVGLEDVAAALAVMTSQGVPAQVATTQLRNAFTELNNPAMKAGEAFQNLTGQVFQDFIAEGHTVAEAMAIMEAEAQRLGIPLSQMFNSIEAGQAALALTGTNMEFFTEATETMGNAAGATERAYAQMNQGIGMALNRLGARWESFLISAGRLIEPFITPLVEAFSTIIAYLAATIESGDSLNDWLADLPTWIRPTVQMLGEFALWLVEVAGAFSNLIAAIQNGVAPLDAIQYFFYQIGGSGAAQAFEDIVYWIGEFGKAAQAILQPVLDWIGANVQMSDVLIALGLAMASVVVPAIGAFFMAFAPLGLLIAGVALLRTAWEENWGGIQEKTAAVVDWFMNTAWPNLQTTFTQLATIWELVILPGLQGMWDWFMINGLPVIIDFFNNQFIVPLQTGIQWMATIWEIISPALTSFYNWFMSEGLAAIIAWVETEVQPRWELFVQALSLLWDAVAIPFTNFFNWFMTDGLAAIMDWIETEVQPRWEFFIAMMGGIWEALQPGFQALADGVEAVLDGIVAGIQAVSDAVTSLQTTLSNAQAGYSYAGQASGQIMGGLASGDYSLGDVVGAFGKAIFGGNQFGGQVKGGVPTWVGEQGPELFVPSGDGDVLNNRDSELAAGGNPPIQIIFNFERGISDQEASEAAYKLTRELRAQGITL